MSITSLRYKRQTILPQVGEVGMDAIRHAHILVVGAGGLGCPALQYLVAAGIGKITLVDGDDVALSNLHRQILFTEDDLGHNKADCAAKKLQKLNHECQITAHNNWLTPANVDRLCHTVDIVLDCADTFAVSYCLSDHCFDHNIPFISASALGLTGYVGGFCGGKPSLRAVFPELPSKAQNCASAGVMGPVVGAIGALQAQFSLNTLINITPSTLGQLVSVNLENFHQTSFRFDGSPEPDQTSILRFTSAEQITESDYIIELRDISVVNPRIQQINVDDIAQVEPRPATKQRTVIACNTGLRAWRAARLMQTYWQGDIVLAALGDQPITIKT